MKTVARTTKKSYTTLKIFLVCFVVYLVGNMYK